MNTDNMGGSPETARQALQELARGADDITGAEHILEQLAKGEPLTIKVGFDPTAPDLHLGHTVVLTAMRRFQDQGHRVIFLIGDFTARIGDPTGRDVTRPPLSTEDIERNARTYAQQVSRILDMSSAEIRHNSEWLAPMTAEDFIRLTASITLARMLERDDFSRRYKEQTPISLHEFIYPLAQAYDSVALQASIEMGGTDQRFNMLLGRELQRQRGQKPQAVITWPLLEGTDGVRKMSKSLDNYIAITEAASEMFGKILSISDALMWKYYQLLSLKTSQQIQQLQAGSPLEAKMQLGLELTERYHGVEQAQQAHQAFIQRFSKRQLPNISEITRKTIPCQQPEMPLVQALTQAGLTASLSEARRAVRQGGVRLELLAEGRKSQKAPQQLSPVSDEAQMLETGRDWLVQVGKRRLA
ncbi:MAG: tyrosine--tRNA ligase, partial [Gammaproteobacteria bacterium]